MPRAALVALAALALACDGETESPPSCATWLECYELCDPWATGTQDAIRQCEASCRAELDYEADAPTPSAGPLAGQGWATIVAAELALIDDAQSIEAQRGFGELAIATRASCRRSAE